LRVVLALEAFQSTINIQAKSAQGWEGGLAPAAWRQAKLVERQKSPLAK
jgi:hypothetical protein